MIGKLTLLLRPHTLSGEEDSHSDHLLLPYTSSHNARVSYRSFYSNNRGAYLLHLVLPLISLAWREEKQQC